MKDLIESNYKVTVNRKKITEKTNVGDFIEKIYEEVNELEEVWVKNRAIDEMELADIILVCLNFAKHYNIDIENQLINKVQLNSKRND